jgi:Holliday junction resolvase-like predicted endonuclease
MNHKICRVEVDLVFKSPRQEIWIVEVKSFSNEQYLERRVTPRQCQRIRHVLRALLERGHKARAHLALVTGNQVRIEEDFFVRDL